VGLLEGCEYRPVGPTRMSWPSTPREAVRPVEYAAAIERPKLATRRTSALIWWTLLFAVALAAAAVLKT
jgi:hypothetical protein